MDKISLLSAQYTQRQIVQNMNQIASASGAAFSPSLNPLSSIGTSQPVAFSKVMGQAIDSVNRQQLIAGAKQEAVDMGLSDDLMGTMVESQKASISFSAMVEVRNKLTSALDQIMNISL